MDNDPSFTFSMRLRRLKSSIKHEKIAIKRIEKEKMKKIFENNESKETRYCDEYLVSYYWLYTSISIETKILMLMDMS